MGSKLTKKMADAIIQTGARRGKVGFHAANAVCATLLGRYVQICDDGPECADPNHEHVDFRLRGCPIRPTGAGGEGSPGQTRAHPRGHTHMTKHGWANCPSCRTSLVRYRTNRTCPKCSFVLRPGR